MFANVRDRQRASRACEVSPCTSADSETIADECCRHAIRERYTTCHTPIVVAYDY